jgi:hypothetical protein
MSSSSKARPAGDDERRLVLAGYRLAERGRLLGVLDEPVPIASPRDAARAGGEVAARLAQAGVGRAAAALARESPDDPATLERLLAALDANPLPEREWPPLRSLLGDDLLGRLVGVSLSSIARYAAGARPTPDVVAARLHLLAMLCADLRAGYNDYGIRRWFVRPRPSLEGAAVADLLGPAWDPDGPAAARTRELAASVLSIGAT